MKNKKTIMFFSSMLILIFHLWINIFKRTNNFYEIETFIRQICFIGVDIFFFLSSYSISKKDIKDYKKFIISRFIKIYVPFILFAIIASIYLKWDIKTFLLTITGINLFIKGGGSFLWFIPAIMIIYVLLPLFNKIKNKGKGYITIIIWTLLTIILSLSNSCNQIFIITNRIPIILIGSYISKYKVLDKLDNKKYIIAMIILITSGILLLYNFKNLLFIKDMYYLTAIPLILGIILLTNLIPSNKIFELLGSITLEMYGIQMIFGYKIASIVLSLINNIFMSNIITITAVILLSFLTNLIFNILNKQIHVI